MDGAPQTWHHGIVAEWWAAFNDDFRPHEIPYFREHVAAGQPALDAGCGAGRLLVPFVGEGFDVDGCDVSADMIAVCRRKAEAAGLAPNLYVQPMHALDLPRRYRTIFVCGAFGLGSTRGQDAAALAGFYDYLEPGGTLLIDAEVPYADANQWAYWLRKSRASLPEATRAPARRSAADGTEFALANRILSLDPLRQHVTLEMHAQRWRGDVLEAEETHTLDIGLYFPNELLLMLERAGFADIVIHGEHQPRPPTPDDDFVVFVARKPHA